METALKIVQKLILIKTHLYCAHEEIKLRKTWTINYLWNENNIPSFSIAQITFGFPFELLFQISPSEIC